MPYPYPDTITGPELVTEYAPIIKGKTILATGVSPNSLGATYVESVAAGQPKLIILTGRSLDKVNQTAELITKAHPEVQTKVLELDLTSFASVRKAAEEVNSWDDVPVIDVLMNNAGVMAVPYELCVDGFEKHLTANHLGHFLFTNLILDKVLAAKDGRVVNISSGAHYISGIRHTDLNYDEGKTYEKWAAYAQSKTANILFSRELAKRLGDRGLLSFSVNPGAIITTNLAGHLDFTPGKDGDEAFFHRSANSDALFFSAGRVSRMGAAPYGWAPPEPISAERGVATHVFASFDPYLKGMSSFNSLLFFFSFSLPVRLLEETNNSHYSARNGAYLEQRARMADYYVDVVSPAAISDIEAEKLWTLSAKAVGL
ncbi:hypothetical protein GGI43DRAFT_424829 [Trichoderma evansii]